MTCARMILRLYDLLVLVHKRAHEKKKKKKKKKKRKERRKKKLRRASVAVDHEVSNAAEKQCSFRALYFLQEEDFSLRNLVRLTKFVFLRNTGASRGRFLFLFFFFSARQKDKTSHLSETFSSILFDNNPLLSRILFFFEFDEERLQRFAHRIARPSCCL